MDRQTSSTGDPAIRMVDVTRDFGEIRAVDGLSMEVPRGSIFGFLGPNGAGKTTTIRLLLGLLEPTAGSVQVFGHDAQTEGDKVRRTAGALFHMAGLYDHLTLKENLEFHGRIWRLPAEERSRRTMELLTAFGLYERRESSAGTLSRGMKQKLAIARALLHRPSLLLLDEPTAGLDPEAAAGLRAMVAEWARDQGVTVLLTTHNLDEAQRVCDRVGVIRKGRLIVCGAPSTLSLNGSIKRLHITGSEFGDDLLAELRGLPGVRSIAPAARSLVIEGDQFMKTGTIIRAIVALGGDIEGVDEETRRSLEDVYLEAMRSEE